jgi:hypothetical protein
VFPPRRSIAPPFTVFDCAPMHTVWGELRPQRVFQRPFPRSRRTATALPKDAFLKDAFSKATSRLFLRPFPQVSQNRRRKALASSPPRYFTPTPPPPHPHTTPTAPSSQDGRNPLGRYSTCCIHTDNEEVDTYTDNEEVDALHARKLPCIGTCLPPPPTEVDTYMHESCNVEVDIYIHESCHT